MSFYAPEVEICGARLEGSIGRLNDGNRTARPRPRAEFIQSESLLMMQASGS